MNDEFGAIARLREVFEAVAPPPTIVHGIGDDAAVLVGSALPLVVTVDAQVEGVHFRREWMSFEDIGYRAFMAAASDVAAMGAIALAGVSAMILPGSFSEGDLLAIARGQAEAAAACGARVVGGNLSRGGELSITTTVFGRVASPLLRRGARVGDVLVRVGALGLSALGLRGRQMGRAAPPRADAAFRRPLARFDGARVLSEHASAAIDVSDGLAQDLAHVAVASGVAFEVEEDALTHEWTEAERAFASSCGSSPTEFALTGGEDYALLATLPATLAALTAPLGGVRLGLAVPADGEGLVRLRRRDGSLAVLSPRGHRHF